ncbi:AAA family ATPase [Streptomyces sp. NPDC101145]|uniref:AAA family ATPase n=1 Tax=Streptomyces sp. NPDC101145 TaxID=3366112 RepID=UPI0038232C50
MYLATLTAENFRVFGARRSPEETGDALELELTPGVTVLLGENDAGKTAVVDAIRLCLLTTAADFYRVTKDDFHVGPGGRADFFTITCRFMELSEEEQGIFLEHLTTDSRGTSSLCISFRAELMDSLPPHRVSVTTRTGPNGEGPTLDGKAREHLKATYLRPLRDAEGELRAGRGSRLSQILAGYPTMKAEGTDDFAADDDSASTLVGILRRAEHHIRSNKAVKAALTSTRGTWRSSPSEATSSKARSGSPGTPLSPALWSVSNSGFRPASRNGPVAGSDTTTRCSWPPNSCYWATTMWLRFF